MATINDFVGFETGGLEETSAFTGAPFVQTLVPRPGSGIHSVLIDKAEDISFTPFSVVADAGNDYVIGFGFRFNTDPLVNSEFFRLLEDTSVFFSLVLVTSSLDLLIRDANDATIRTVTAPLTVSDWHFVEVYIQHQASGTVEVFIDGVSQGIDTAQDLTDGGTFDTVTFRHDADTTQFIAIDDFYTLSGASSSADRIGDAQVFKYQSAKASATPDDGGDNLDTGTWDLAGQTPLDNSAGKFIAYTSAGAGAVDSNTADGSPEGPLNDTRITGELKAMKAVCNMRRGTGSPSNHFILLGNNVDGTTRSQELGPGTSFVNTFFLTELATIVPTKDEFCRIGIETTGNQDFDCGEMWAMLLHSPTERHQTRRMLGVMGFH